MIEACLVGDIDRVCALVDAFPRGDPAYAMHLGVHAAAVALLDVAPPEGVYHKIRRLLEQPSADTELRLLLLFNASILAVRVRRHDEARRLFRLARSLGLGEAGPALQAGLHLAEALLRESVADYAGATELCTVALRQPIEFPGRFWARLKGERARCAILAHDFTTAEGDLTELEAHPASHGGLRVPLASLQARLCCESGRPEEGLRHLDETTVENAGLSRGAYVQLSVELLVRAGKTDEAGIVLGQAITEVETLSGPAAMGLHAMLALFAGDIGLARQKAQEAIVGVDRGLPVDFELALRTLAEVELASGSGSKARRILLRLDPDMSRRALQMHWARLCLLEDNLIRASEHFQHVHALGTAYVAQAVRTASEMPAYKLAQLLAATDSPRAQPMQMPEPLPPSPQVSTLKLVGISPCMKRVRRQIESYGLLRTPVLISGETGTGKEVVARLLHEQSLGSGQAFVPINCAAISDTLLESELFGHAKGAFTGADQDHDGLFLAAGAGSILLDEIHAMSPRMQAALLRVLENGEVRPVGSSAVMRTAARVIAATNEDTDELLASGRLRSDLYYRLAGLQINLEPLRQRPEDIAALTAYWLRDMRGNYDVVASEQLIATMGEDSWPGNVRQLYSQLDRILLHAGNARVLSPQMYHATVKARTQPETDRSVTGADLQQPENATGNPRNTLDRRRRLRRLVDQRDRITRADVVQLLGCSPNTATRDLKALVEEGYVRRVTTSAHLRTSYFVRGHGSG